MIFFAAPCAQQQLLLVLEGLTVVSCISCGIVRAASAERTTTNCAMFVLIMTGGETDRNAESMQYVCTCWRYTVYLFQKTFYYM